MIQDRLYGLKSNGCWFLKKEQALENGQRKPIKNVWLKSNGCWCLKRDQALGMDIKEMIKESQDGDARCQRMEMPLSRNILFLNS